MKKFSVDGWEPALDAHQRAKQLKAFKSWKSFGAGSQL